MITDDPNTPGPGFWEINLSAQSDSTRNEHRIETPRIDVNYGVGSRIQLKIEMPWVQMHDIDGTRGQGPGDINTGVKWRFLGKEGARMAWSVYPQIELNTARSSVNKELVDAGPDLQFPTEITLEIARVAINGEVGRNVIAHSEGNWIAGLSTGVHASPRLELLAELHAQATRRQPSQLIANVGARPKLSRQITLLTSIGRTLHSGRGELHQLLAYGGLQFNLPGLDSPP